VQNNPIRYTDPSGHYCVEEGEDGNSNHANCKTGEILKTKSKSSLSYTKQFSFVFDKTKEIVNNELDSVKVGSLFTNMNDREVSFFKFAWKVRTGGEWDAKVWLRNEFDNPNSNLDAYVFPLVDSGDEYYYDIHGNLIYGYIGSALGISEDDLLDNAGNMNFMDDALSPSRDVTAQPGINGSRKYDDPRDQLMIQVGIGLWGTYRDQMTLNRCIEQ
jgi:hypothetical protein